MKRNATTPFGNCLKFLRLEKNLSQAELAASLQISAKRFSAIETGRIGPPEGSELQKLIDMLRLDSADAQRLQVAAMSSSRVIRLPRTATAEQIALAHRVVRDVLQSAAELKRKLAA